ncbi:F-box domain-containing protein [Diplogelasinospora grovesii]|uniref:F-box domain-containing protein n=1 Tax=Diplogelasinospora grovesii TaxID=303347 RepID=A0AAN6ND47_9PEZI|nr:F-box domain-containing protein [Diplogelasinospora grovesii]
MAPVFEPHQVDAVMRAAAYRRLDFERAVIWSVKGENDPVITSLAEPFPSTPIFNLSTLEMLPLELVLSICLFLDVRSFLTFRQVNRRARVIATSGLHEYRRVAQYGLESLYAVLRTGEGIWKHYTRLLCTRRCTVCGMGFSNFLHLLAATRCCFLCLNSQPPCLQVTSLSWIAFLVPGKHTGQHYRLLVEKLQPFLRILRTLPGAYGVGKRPDVVRTSRGLLVEWNQAVNVVRSFGLESEDGRNFVQHPLWGYYVSTTLPLFDRADGQVQYGVSCKGCQCAYEDQAARYGSDHGGVLWRRSMQVYTQQDYLDHFVHCPWAICLWEASKGGTVQVPDSKEVLWRSRPLKWRKKP